MIDSVEFQRAVMIGLLRIICPDDLDEFSIARTATVGHDDLVIGAILRAFSA